MNRVAILSLHSHTDRSFLDDAQLALVSGDLKANGIENDLVLAALNPELVDRGSDPVEQRLIETLSGYGIIVFERVWSQGLIERLRAALPKRVFVWCRGEHNLSNPPADWICSGDLRSTLPLLAGFLLGRVAAPPP